MSTHVLLLGVPVNSVVGVDFQAFESNAVFRGVKNIKQGWHIVHFQHLQANNGIRYGYWLNESAAFKYDEQREMMVPCAEGVLQDCWAYMVNFTDSEAMVEVKAPQLESILGRELYIDSVMTSSEENSILLKVLEQRGLNARDPLVTQMNTERELKYTWIDLKKSVPAQASAQEKMRHFLDKSWYFDNLLKTRWQNNVGNFISEWNIAYIHMTLFANHSSALQWHHMVELVMQSKRNQQLVNVFRDHLSHFPKEYVEELLNKSIKVTDPECRELWESLWDADEPEIEPYDDDMVTIGSADEDEDAPVIVGGVYYV